MSDLVEALHAARESYVREDYASRVKQVFREHLEMLEPDAEIEDTLYFNHSAIPDFKLTWGRGAKGKSSRDVFLRSSYAAVVAGNETVQITSGDPIFLSISADQVVEEPGFAMTKADVSHAASQARYSLLTDVEAFKEIAAPVKDDNPLSSAVRSNFLRGGRGLVDEPVAERLLLSGSDTGESVTDLIRETFFEDAVVRMERTALLVHWAMSPNEAIDGLAKLDGVMSTDELRSVLPWLLSRATAPKRDGFWAALGSLFSFEQLESLASELNGMDLTGLVQANLRTWSAKRAYVGLNVDVEGNPVSSAAAASDGSIESADPDQESDTGSSGWRFNSGTLGLALGSTMIRVSNSGYKLKARPGSSTPKWSATVGRLDGYSLRSASISGIERAFRIDARESGNVRRDVETVVHSVEDSYFVSHVEVMLPGPDLGDEDTGAESASVDFAGGIVVADRAVQLGALTRAAANILANQGLDEQLHPSDPHEPVEQVDP
ncbi:hypothetical protein [Microbacterium marinilacus]|uniref:Uncharacterized protein n=1 Tax=Microbacterium marinilacus TaxID=415209 RepID=A0ABP7BLK0_9MICO|nr:hypothetical protein [Microbacterium marinilacus]MBY0688803.1 hypothetical protein [Microbacterium marinilacus]